MLARAPTDPRAGVAGASDEIDAAEELAIGTAWCVPHMLYLVSRIRAEHPQALAAAAVALRVAPVSKDVALAS